MSQIRHIKIERPPRAGDRVWTTQVVADRDYAIRRHAHNVHELLWGFDDLRSVEVDDQVWIIPPDVGLWIPAGAPHRGQVSASASYRSTFIAAEDQLPSMPAPTAVMVPPALSAMLAHLDRDDLGAAARQRAEAVVLDLIEPTTASSFWLPMPRDPRLRIVARAMIAAPDDERCLTSWGNQVGASARTLTRLFTAETGLSFGQWRTHARVRAALLLLAGGRNVSETGRAVGYRTSSAFVRAFRQTTGQTPGAYVRSATPANPPAALTL